LRTGLYPAISQNHGLQYFALLSFVHPPASAKFANAPSTTQAAIVLSDFARSWSVDGGSFNTMGLLNESKTKAGKGLSEKVRVFCLQR